MPADSPAELQELIEEERRLILSGAWAGLRSLAPRKERCLEALSALDPVGISPIAAGLAHNQALLRAALDGLREVTRRRAAIASAHAGLVTYDATGARAHLPTSPPRFERKA